MIGILQEKGANFEMVNDLNQTPLFFGSKRLIEKLGLRNKPVNFVAPTTPSEKVDHLVKVSDPKN